MARWSVNRHRLARCRRWVVKTWSLWSNCHNKSAHYQLEAALVQPGTEPVRSLRDFDVQSKPLRIIIETDAGGDPDDEQSLVRFLVYANEFDIEGIIANRPVARDRENQNPSATDWASSARRSRLTAQCYANLVQHDPRFPTPEQLLSRTVAGYDDTDDGVNLILRAVDADDPRPVWFCNWGTDHGSAASCLKRALDRVLRERGPAGYAKFKSRLRLSSADKFGEHTTTFEPPFPLWVDTFRPPLDSQRWYHRFSALTATAGGFDLERDVRTGHGPLGALYPTNTGLPQKEGDTMAFLYLVPTGMNDPNAADVGQLGRAIRPERGIVPANPISGPTRRTRGVARRAATTRSPAGPSICRTISAPAWTGAWRTISRKPTTIPSPCSTPTARNACWNSASSQARP